MVGFEAVLALKLGAFVQGSGIAFLSRFRQAGSWFEWRVRRAPQMYGLLDLEPRIGCRSV